KRPHTRSTRWLRRRRRRPRRRSSSDQFSKAGGHAFAGRKERPDPGPSSSLFGGAFEELAEELGHRRGEGEVRSDEVGYGDRFVVVVAVGLFDLAGLGGVRVLGLG